MQLPMMTEGRERRWWCRCLQGRELLRWRGGDTVDGDDDGKEEGSSRKATSSTQQRPSTSEPAASSTEMGEAAQQGNIRWWWCWLSIVKGEGIHGNKEDTNWGGTINQMFTMRIGAFWWRDNWIYLKVRKVLGDKKSTLTGLRNLYKI